MNTTENLTFNNRSYSNNSFKQYLGLEKKFGYLHAFRRLPNSATYVVKISVPIGQSDNRTDRIQYVNFELYVKAAEALTVFFENNFAINDENTKVSARFSCSNVIPRAYIAQKGERQGQAIPYLSGNLNYLHMVKVDGKHVYGFQASQEAEDQNRSNAYQNVQSAGGSTDTQAPNVEEPPLSVYEDELDGGSTGEPLAAANDTGGNKDEGVSIDASNDSPPSKSSSPSVTKGKTSSTNKPARKSRSARTTSK